MRVKKRYFYFLIPAVLILLVAGLTFYYPVSLKPADVSVGENFEEQLIESERKINPTPGTEKKIIWANPEKTRTRTSIVYIHGFSATNKEISPTAELLAKKYNANLFLTRLTGHGLGSDGMKDVRVDKLLADAEEALLIAKKLGDQVVIIGTSTGAMLSLYLSYKYPDDVFVQILISPNFRPKRWESWLLKGPFGSLMAKMFIGEYYEFKPANSQNETFWTSRYPSAAVAEMMNLIGGIRSLPLSRIRVPTLVLYTEQDRVVSVDLIKKYFNKLGSPKKKLQQVLAPHHVLAGEILSPKTTHSVVVFCDDFLNGILR
jgi:esterase/lipase